MAHVSTYLNFPGTTEKAFLFYKSVFGGEFSHPIARYGDNPVHKNPEESNRIVHVALPILGGHQLMGSDVPLAMESTLSTGNNVYISLHPETRKELERLFQGLSQGGTVETEPQEMFWGDYYGSCTDQFGIQWVFNTESKE